MKGKFRFRYQNQDYFYLEDMLEKMPIKDLNNFRFMVFKELVKSQQIIETNKEEKIYGACVFVMGGILVCCMPFIGGIIKLASATMGLAGMAYGVKTFKLRNQKQNNEKYVNYEINEIYEKILKEIKHREDGKEIFPEFFED